MSMCANCRFYRKGHLAGTCRYSPPTVPPDSGFAEWPKVDASDWCRNHEALPAPEDPQVTEARRRVERLQALEAYERAKQ